jgi:hypothetical protein
VVHLKTAAFMSLEMDREMDLFFHGIAALSHVLIAQ